MIDRYSRKELRDIWADENKYKIWLEIELASNANEYNSQHYPKSVAKPDRSSTSKARIGDFVAYLKDGDKVYKMDIKVHSDNGKNISSADSSGGRGTLGKYIKGKLQDAGVLKKFFSVSRTPL